MTAIKNVAVVGASGNVGRPVVEQLQAAGFNVTALVRESSTATFAPGVHVTKVNYQSPESIQKALEGQDAVVSAAATMETGNQKPIIDAAIDAGVKRFIPSEFGINTRTVTHPQLRTILKTKIDTVDYLIEQSKKNPSFTWTGVTTGMFFDWGLKIFGLGFDKTNKKATIIDSGDKTVSYSNLPFVGKAVAAILQKPDETADQYLATTSFVASPNELCAILEELSGGAKWDVVNLKSADVGAEGRERLAKGDFSAFMNLLTEYLQGDGYEYSAKSETYANDLLGIGYEDPRTTLKAWLDGTL